MPRLPVVVPFHSVCFSQWHGFTWLDPLWMDWAAGAVMLICVWSSKEMWVALSLYYVCHPECVCTIRDTHFLLNTYMFFLFFFFYRKNTILLAYSVSSKGCSSHYVSHNEYIQNVEHIVIMLTYLCFPHSPPGGAIYPLEREFQVNMKWNQNNHNCHDVYFDW